MFEQNPPKPNTRTPVNSILGGKVKGGRKGGAAGQLDVV